MVSAVPTSPDWTTKASRPAVRHSSTSGSDNQRRRRELIVAMEDIQNSSMRTLRAEAEARRESRVIRVAPSLSVSAR